VTFVDVDPEAGRREAFEALLRPLLDKAYGVAVTMTRHRTDAEDLVQEAALRAYRAFDSFERGTNFKAWFYRILINCTYGRHRAMKRAPASVDLDDASELYLYRQTRAVGLHDRNNDPASLVLERLSAEKITEAIGQLPEEYAVVASLYFLEDYAYQEIADAIGCPVGTVRSRLHRGRRMLQRLLWATAREEGIISTLMEAPVEV
jgi:RNA polymerase sigma-70 factor (ECF subfamily)